MNIQKVKSSNCKTDYRVQVGVFDETVEAYAIVGGTLALTLKNDWLFSKRFNHCEERNSYNPDYSNWKAWDGVHIDQFEGGADTIYNYVLKAVAQREVQNDRLRILGPGRRSPRFHDTKYGGYFYCDWGWDGIIGHGIFPARRSSGVSSVHVTEVSENSPCGYWSIPFASEDWQIAYERLNGLPQRLNFKRLYQLDEQEFDDYYAAISPLQKYKAITR